MTPAGSGVSCRSPSLSTPWTHWPHRFLDFAKGSRPSRLLFKLRLLKISVSCKERSTQARALAVHV